MAKKEILEIDNFCSDFKKRTMQTIADFNGSNSWQKNSWEIKSQSSDNEQGTYNYFHEVNASRGNVFEKATVSEIFIKSSKASKTFIQRGLAKDGDSVDARVLQVEIFPCSPIIPMGHINFERFCSSKYFLTTNQDIFPTSTPVDEIEKMREQIAVVVKKYGKNQQEMSLGLAEQYNMDGWEKPLAGRAGFQLKMVPLEENYRLAIEGAEAFIEAYMKMVERLKNSPFNEEDVIKMNKMRCHWLEYLLIKDGAVRMSREKGHPFDALRWMGLPPTIHY